METSLGLISPLRSCGHWPILRISGLPSVVIECIGDDVLSEGCK